MTLQSAPSPAADTSAAPPDKTSSNGGTPPSAEDTTNGNDSAKSSTASSTDFLPRGLDSGDVVLFNRRCTSMSFLGAAVCIAAKLLSNTAWDHVGIVVRDPKTGELLFLEADFGGVKLRSLAERISRSRSKEIAVRKLSCVRTDAMRQSLFEFAHEMLDKKYDISTDSMLWRVSNQSLKQEEQHYRMVLDDKSSQLNDINAELRNSALTPIQRRFLNKEKKRVQEKIAVVDKHLQQLRKESNSYKNDALRIEDRQSMTQEAALQLSDEQITGGAIPVSKDIHTVFCSKLVAAAYQRIGLLEHYPPAFDYNPKDFSSEQANSPKLYLRHKANLGPEIFFRISRERARAEEAKKQNGGKYSGLSIFQNTKSRFRGVAEGDAPSQKQRRLIRDALKRSPVYSTIPDQIKISGFVKSFKAIILEPGDTLFTQGDYGNDFFIVESGSVDRYVGRGNEPPMLTTTLGPRSSFGSTGFLFTSPRNSTIRSRERTLLWRVDRVSYELFKDGSVDPAQVLSDIDHRILRRIMAHHFLFSRLDRVGPKEVNTFFPVKFRAGEVIFKQGDTGDNFYIIKSGEVERHIRRPRTTNGSDSNGRGEEDTALATTLRSGQSFGELSLMYNAPRASTVRARTDVELFAISNDRFHRLNLGSGTKFLRTRFDKSASLTRDGSKYMTPDDFLNKIANANDFEEKDRARLSSLLVSLVSNNRERDPIKAARKHDQLLLSKQESATPNKRFPFMGNRDAVADNDNDRDGDIENFDEEVFMDFWDFVRFDIVLNQPSPELDFAFRLADQDNTGFISFDEIQYLLQIYADIDDTARKMLSGEIPTLMKAFGKDGSKLLSAAEFHHKSADILPPTFRRDVKVIEEHMRNVDISSVDDDDLRFVHDKSPSLIGSQFISKKAGSSMYNANDSRLKGANVTSKNDPLPNLIGLGFASACSRTIVAPLERLKIMMQADTHGKYRGVLNASRSMIREETSFSRAMFRGNGVNLMRIIPTALIQLGVVNALHDLYSDEYQSLDKDARRIRALEKVMIGGLSGFISTALLYPLEFARGRISLQNATFSPYSGAIDCLRKTAAKDGIRSIYRGLTPSILGIFPYVGISFSAFEALRPALPKKNDGSAMPSTQSAILAGVVVMGLAQTVTYPLDLCRRRMQVAGFSNNEPLRSFGGTVRAIYRQAGVGGFFRGITPNLLKVAPSTAVSFFAIDYARQITARSSQLYNKASGSSISN